MATRLAVSVAGLATGDRSGSEHFCALGRGAEVAVRGAMSASELSGLDREFDSLFRSQVRELESESLYKTPVRKRTITREQTPLREEPNGTPLRFVRDQSPRQSSPRIQTSVARIVVREQRPMREVEADATPVRPLPQFKRSLVESRRAMRSMQASQSRAAALSLRIPMTVLVATSATA